MTLEQAEEFIKLSSSASLPFHYLFNAPCMNNMEWDRATHEALREHVSWLCDSGVEGVIVAMPYLLELVKCQFPQLRLEVSTISHVNSVARAQFFESLGADAIMLDSNINRDFKLLEAIRKSVKCELGILINSSCLYQCPYEYYHNNTLGHASQTHNQLNGWYMDYCVLHCSMSNFDDLSQLIKARWIRPEDIHLYEELGIDFFKIGGRAKSTEWIINASQAYAAKSYPGNLHDIINNFSPKTRCISANLSDTQISTIASPPKVYIDNQALDGFIDFFKKQNCLAECGRCQYCQEVANRVVRVDHNKVDEYITVLKKLLDDLAHSNMFAAEDSRTVSQVSTGV
ncbi:MAG: U32 family peptidase [Dehalococcoidales bacterium]|nr:U32 family peptidase [Dehalococcoidales bacterium]